MARFQLNFSHTTRDQELWLLINKIPSRQRNEALKTILLPALRKLVKPSTQTPIIPSAPLPSHTAHEEEADNPFDSLQTFMTNTLRPP